MRFLAFVVFAFNVGIIIYIIRRWNAGGGRVELNPAKWSNLNKFFTLPVSLFCVLVLAGTFVMVTHSNNEIDQMYRDAVMATPSEREEIAERNKNKKNKYTNLLPIEKIETAKCVPMLLGEDRRRARANVVCYDKKGERSRPTWEEFDKIKQEGGSYGSHFSGRKMRPACG